jgi:hypothetical protein
MRGAAAAFVGTPHAGGFLEDDATFVVVALPGGISGTPETSASKTPRYHSPCIAPTSAYAFRPCSILSMQGPCPGGSPRNVPAIATGGCMARRPKGWVCEHPQAATLCRDREVRCAPPRVRSRTRRHPSRQRQAGGSSSRLLRARVSLPPGCWPAPADQAATARGGGPVRVCRRAPPDLPAESAVSTCRYGDGSGPPPRRSQ